MMTFGLLLVGAGLFLLLFAIALSIYLMMGEEE
jgi:hypothetical protein